MSWSKWIWFCNRCKKEMDEDCNVLHSLHITLLVDPTSRVGWDPEPDLLLEEKA